RGCAPDGALAALPDRLPTEALGTDRAWLGDISMMAPAPPPGTAPSWWSEDLGDVVVLAQRLNITAPDTVDIDLDSRRRSPGAAAKRSICRDVASCDKPYLL